MWEDAKKNQRITKKTGTPDLTGLRWRTTRIGTADFWGLEIRKIRHVALREQVLGGQSHFEKKGGKICVTCEAFSWGGGKKKRSAGKKHS